MSRTFLRRSAVAAVVLGALVVPSWAAAEAETFHRFEVNAVANYTITQTCADGTTRITRVQVIGGFEEETEDGVTESDEFLTVRIFGSDCAGPLNEFGSGPGEFEFSPSLQEASVTGTVTTSGGRVVTVDMDWEGTGELETETNTTTRPGFTGLFVEKERDAVATGTVVVDGTTLVDGSTTNAFIRTFEDRNTTTGQA